MIERQGELIEQKDEMLASERAEKDSERAAKDKALAALAAQEEELERLRAQVAPASEGVPP